MSRNGRSSVDMGDVAVDIEGLEVEDRRSGMSASRRLFHRHYNRLKDHIFDAYSPVTIRKKLVPIIFLRASKAAAILCNTGFGYAFLGWNLGESKLLDFVGKETHQLFTKLYGRELCREEVMAFLDRRLYWCAVTCSCTLLQIFFTKVGLHSVTLAISIILAPITLLDRQWCALVTRMPSRYNRSQVCKLSGHLSRSLSHLATAPGMPTRFGLRGFHTILSVMEFAVAVTQLLSGAAIMAFSIWSAIRPVDTIGPSIILMIVVTRTVKEAANLISPLIEKRRQPAQFDRNEDCVRQVLHGLSAVASSPVELALRIHEQPESEGEFMASCQTLTSCVTCGSADRGSLPDKGSSDGWLNMLLGKDKHEGEAAGMSQGEGGGEEGDVMIVHTHAPECLPSFFRGKWREGGQEAMLKMMLEAGQVGPCWWARFHDGHEHGEGVEGSASMSEHVHRHSHGEAGVGDAQKGFVHSHAPWGEGGMHYHKHKHMLPDGGTYEHSHTHCHSGDSIHTHPEAEVAGNVAGLGSIGVDSGRVQAAV